MKLKYEAERLLVNSQINIENLCLFFQIKIGEDNKESYRIGKSKGTIEQYKNDVLLFFK